MKTILSSTDRLLYLTTELFELSKLEAKEIQPNIESFSLAELLQDIHQKNLIIAQSKNINLNLEMEDNLPFIRADIGMMEKVFQNLLDNAFKFTNASGSITISLKRKNENFISAEISDTGMGISSEDLTQIFDRYIKPNQFPLQRFLALV